jgi:hypothetical protein
MALEAISRIGFWFKIAAGPSLKPQEYLSISRICDEAPTKRLGQKTFLRWLLKNVHKGGRNENRTDWCGKNRAIAW